MCHAVFLIITVIISLSHHNRCQHLLHSSNNRRCRRRHCRTVVLVTVYGHVNQSINHLIDGPWTAYSCCVVQEGEQVVPFSVAQCWPLVSQPMRIIPAGELTSHPKAVLGGNPLPEVGGACRVVRPCPSPFQRLATLRHHCHHASLAVRSPTLVRVRTM